MMKKNVITLVLISCVIVGNLVFPTISDDNLAYAQTSSTRRINIPYFGSGEIRYPETAVFWFGQITPTENYSDVRVGYNDEGLFVSLSIADRRLWYDEDPSTNAFADWDAASLYLSLDGNQGLAIDGSDYHFIGQMNWWESRESYQAVYVGVEGVWTDSDLVFTTTSGWRGDAPNNDSDDRGWRISFRVPFASLGLPNAPEQGSIWGLAITLYDRDDEAGTGIPDKMWPEIMSPDQPSSWGQLVFGNPEYSPPQINPTGTTIIQHKLDDGIVLDAAVGGTIDNLCPGDSYFIWNEWGNANFGQAAQFNVQNQSDIADWPCYSKYYVKFPLDTIPEGKVIISATLTIHQFGNAGGGAWDEPEMSWIQVSSIGDQWDDNTLTWNNAPLAEENIAAAWVDPLDSFPGWPGVPRTWDVSRAVANAHTDGEPLQLALYSADSAYHSGKYFVASETGDWNAEGRPALEVVWGNPASATTFADVPMNHWAHDFIETLYENGYIAGCSFDPLLYCPERVLSRAESSVFVLRGDYGAIPNPPYDPPLNPTFSDVAPDHWGYGWIESLWLDGYTAGCSTNPLQYCPSRQHTRAEGSVFFLRIKNGVSYQPPDPTGIFTDVDLDSWYAPWVEAAYNAELLPACAHDPLAFCPEELLDRAWAAYMMVQAKGLSTP